MFDEEDIFLFIHSSFPYARPLAVPAKHGMLDPVWSTCEIGPKHLKHSSSFLQKLPAPYIR